MLSSIALISIRLTPARDVKLAVSSVLADLDTGKLRVATRKPGTQEWETHQWIKKAVLLSFRLEDNKVLEGGATATLIKYPQNSLITPRPISRLVVFA